MFRASSPIVGVPTLLQSGQGIVSEGFDRALAVSALQPASGALRYVGMPLVNGQVVTNLVCDLTIGQAAGTSAWLLLYDRVGNLLAQSASNPGAFTATGQVPLAMQTPYLVTNTGTYFAGFLLITGGTMPTFAGASPGATGIGNALGTGLIRGGGQSGLGAVPNPATIAAGGLNWLPWIAAT